MNSSFKIKQFGQI